MAPNSTITGSQALQLLDEAWALTADAFARQQIREFLRAQGISASSSPPGHWNPWVPGLAWWVPRRAQRSFRKPPPPEALLVARDMLALRQVPGVLPTHRDEVARRIRDEGEAALWELRVAGQYAGAGIPVEWAAITSTTVGAPDVWLPASNAVIQVKRLQPRADPLADLEPVFRNVRRAHSQLKGATGPSAVVIAIPGPYSFKEWEPDDSAFRRTLHEWFAEADFARVSALVFTCEPRLQNAGRGLFHYGNFAWRWRNPNALHPWPDELPLISDGPGATG